MRATTVIVLLLVSLAASATAQPNGPTDKPTANGIVERTKECIGEALTPPPGLELPDHCGWGLWLPRPLYLDLRRWADRGSDCQADINSELRKSRALCDAETAKLDLRLKLHIEDKEALRKVAHPSWFTLLWKGALGIAAGAGLGAAGGFGLSFVGSSDDHARAAGIGAALGGAASGVAVVVFELLR